MRLQEKNKRIENKQRSFLYKITLRLTEEVDSGKQYAIYLVGNSWLYNIDTVATESRSAT
jgi:hypothetical protein